MSDVTEKEREEDSQSSKRFRFFFVGDLLTTTVGSSRKKRIEVYEKQMDWLLEPNGKQRSFNCLGNSGRNVTSFGAQSADGSIS